MENKSIDNYNQSILFTDANFKDDSFSFVVKSFKREEMNTIDFKLSDCTFGNHINDSAALIASTLCGQSYKNIQIDWPISLKCKNILTSFTRATINCLDILTESYDTRQNNDKTLLNFSGGLDSLSILPLIPEDKIELVSIDFGHNFERELNFFKKFNTHILKTNLRELKYDRESWTFILNFS